MQIVDAIRSMLDENVPRFSRHPELDSRSSYKDLITFVEDRAGHDRRYAIDATKLETKLGWRADENFESRIIKTVEWYINKNK